jgi:hypothetical protein
MSRKTQNSKSVKRISLRSKTIAEISSSKPEVAPGEAVRKLIQLRGKLTCPKGKSTHSTPRADPSTTLTTSAGGMPFDKPSDKLKAVSVPNGSRPRAQPRGSACLPVGRG